MDEQELKHQYNKHIEMGQFYADKATEYSNPATIKYYLKKSEEERRKSRRLDFELFKLLKKGHPAFKKIKAKGESYTIKIMSRANDTIPKQ